MDDRRTLVLDSNLEENDRIRLLVKGLPAGPGTLALYREQQGPVELCRGACAELAGSGLAFDLSGSPLPPVRGGNLYRLSWTPGEEGASGSTFPFAFTYGPVARAPAAGVAPVRNLSVYLDQEKSLRAFTRVEENFFNDLFRLDYPRDGDLHEVTFSEVFQLNSSNTLKKVPAYHWGNCYDGPALHKIRPDGIPYIEDVGPFCNVDVSNSAAFSGLVDMKATADFYMSDVEPIHAPDNTEMAYTTAPGGFVDANFGVRRFRNRMVAVVRIHEARVPLGDGGLDVTSFLKGTYVVSMAMEVGGLHNPRYLPVSSRTRMSLDEEGRIGFRIPGFFDTFDLDQSANQPFLDVTGWTGDVLEVGDMVIEGKDVDSGLLNWAFDSLLLGFSEDIFDGLLLSSMEEQVAGLANRTTNLIIRDLVENMSPEVMNRVLYQMKKGMSLGLPDWIPWPWNEMTLSLGMTMLPPLSVVHLPEQGLRGLSAPGRVTLDVEGPLPAGLEAPAAPGGQPGWIQRDQPGAPPAPLARGDGDEAGFLISLRNDPLNEALYRIWQQGAAAIRLDRDFADRLYGATGDQRLGELMEKVMRPDILLDMFSTGDTRWYRPDGSLFIPDPDGTVTMEFRALAPPGLRLLPVSTIAVPGFRLDAGALELTIRIHQSDGETLVVNRSRLQLAGRAGLDLIPYSGQAERPEHASTAIRLVLSTDPQELFYHVRPGDDPADNPLALDDRVVQRILNDLVTSLFMPVLNEVLGEVPVPEMQGCGLAVDQVRLRPSPPTRAGEQPVLTLVAPLSNYDFQGVCRL